MQAGEALSACGEMAEDASDLGDGFAAGFDVAHGGAEVLVPGLGHDELERDSGVAEVVAALRRRWWSSSPA